MNISKILSAMRDNAMRRADHEKDDDEYSRRAMAEACAYNDAIMLLEYPDFAADMARIWHAGYETPATELNRVAHELLHLELSGEAAELVREAISKLEDAACELAGAE